MFDNLVNIPEKAENSETDIEALIPADILSLARQDMQRAIPAIAKNAGAIARLERAIQKVPVRHKLFQGDSRYLAEIPDRSIHLAVTSPPYWTLKKYPDREGQLGAIADYETFLDELDKVWEHIFRVLVPGGRLVVVVGDVCVPRRSFGRHLVFPLHASIQERCRQIGFDNLAPIVWHKIANITLEAKRSTQFLGKPYEPNAIIKNDIEYILLQRKPGGYRQPTLAQRLLSVIPEQSHRDCFQQIWTVGGESTRRHPAPYPLAIPERLIRMFSFVGDTVLDPFMGTGTTNLAAQSWGRHSIGCEIEPRYFDIARDRLEGSNSVQLTIDFGE